MSQLVNQNAAAHPEAASSASGHRALSTLSKVTLLALLVLLISTLFFSQPLLQYYITHPAYRPAFFLPPHKGHHLRMVRVGATPEPLGLKGVSGWDNLASRDTGTDRRPLAGSALDGEHSGEIFDPLLHREQT